MPFGSPDHARHVEPIFVPRLQIHLAEFPDSLCSYRPETAHLGDLLRTKYGLSDPHTNPCYSSPAFQGMRRENDEHVRTRHALRAVAPGPPLDGTVSRRHDSAHVEERKRSPLVVPCIVTSSDRKWSPKLVWGGSGLCTRFSFVLHPARLGQVPCDTGRDLKA